MTCYFLTAHTIDPYSTEVVQTAGKPGSTFSYDLEEALVRKSEIDGPLQKVVLESLRARVL